MERFISFGRKLERLCFRFRVLKVNPFWVQLAYFLVLSLVGFGALKMSSKPRTEYSFRPNNIDVFFTSVSAATVSSMSTVEMEVFSNTQLIIMTVLMLVGGEVFVSMIGIQLQRSMFWKQQKSPENRAENAKHETHELELGNITQSSSNSESNYLKYKSIRILGYLVLSYLLLFHIVGSSVVSMYVSLVPSAKKILKNKGIKLQTFSVFTVVSTFANCGFVPTSENMIVFKKNSGLLLLLIPQILAGNTLYPACLRVLIWVLYKITKRKELSYILQNYKEMGYVHLMSGFRCFLLFATVFGFLVVQLVLFCSMEWNSEALDGLSSYQKFVGSLFEVVNSRHSGESIVDLSTISSAILVLFVVMMYLPPYTSFLPATYEEKGSRNDKAIEKGGKGKRILECVLFSQLTYLAIFIILICITERQKLKDDPLNFNVLNITIEVISAYGNVGFSNGYSCKRQLRAENSCIDTWTGFAGRWSNTGKFILIIVMFFGRLKKFSMKGGKAWKLS